MSKKYYYDENFFDVIDNESKAYFLGLLYADGYINDKKGYNYIELTLHKDDYETLKNFMLALKSNRTPILIKNGKYYRIIINSKKIVGDLNKLGCTNNKTHTIKFPDFINDNLLHHFIRGYFDGDGSIWCNKKRDHYNIQFDGNRDFLIGIKNYINNKLDIRDKKFSKRHKNRVDNIVTLKYGGNCIIKKIYNILYKDSNYYMSRKYNKFLLAECKHSINVEYNGIYYSGHNMHDLYNIIVTKTGLKREKINYRFRSGWNVYDIIKYGKKDKNKKTIMKINDKNELIETYISLEEAGRKNKINPDTISRNAKKNKKYKNYYWRFKDE